MHLPEPGERVRQLGCPAHQHRQTDPATLESVGVAARSHLYSNSRSNEGEITDILLPSTGKQMTDGFQFNDALHPWQPSKEADLHAVQ